MDFDKEETIAYGYVYFCLNMPLLIFCMFQKVMLTVL